MCLRRRRRRRLISPFSPSSRQIRHAYFYFFTFILFVVAAAALLLSLPCSFRMLKQQRANYFLHTTAASYTWALTTSSLSLHVLVRVLPLYKMSILFVQGKGTNVLRGLFHFCDDEHFKK